MTEMDLLFVDDVKVMFNLPDNIKTKKITYLSDNGVLPPYEMLFGEPVWKQDDFLTAAWNSLHLLAIIYKTASITPHFTPSKED